MKMDGRKRSQSAQQAIREIAVVRVMEGERVEAVAESLGVSRSAVFAWVKKVRKYGIESLASRKRTGRRRTLHAEQEAQVREWIQGKDPRQYGFDFGLWTRRIVAELVLESFGVELSLVSIGRMLHRLGISPQKPLARAYERDPEAIRRWVEEQYPELKQRARKERATIFFLDEAGFRSDEPRGRTWGVRGQTPVVQTSGRRQRVSAISAVTADGKFWWDTFVGSLTADRFIGFLQAFMKGRRRKVFLVLDSHPAHRAKKTLKFVESLGDRLELHFLPGYAPELNPDEWVWQHVKTNGIRATPLKEDESLLQRVRADLRKLARFPHLLRSMFKAPPLQYILSP
jgi:transposase